MLFLEHGKPMIFGKDGDKGIRMNGMHPEVVQLGNGVSESDLLVHDATRPTPALAFILSRMHWPEYPEPLGVFRAVESAKKKKEKDGWGWGWGVRGGIILVGKIRGIYHRGSRVRQKKKLIQEPFRRGTRRAGRSLHAGAQHRVRAGARQERARSSAS